MYDYYVKRNEEKNDSLAKNIKELQNRIDRISKSLLETRKRIKATSVIIDNTKQKCLFILQSRNNNNLLENM